jgi:hypothetical protein
MSQQPKSMLAKTEPCAISDPGAQLLLKNFAISEIFANSEFLRVCGTKSAIFDPKHILMVPAMHQNIQ